MIFLTTLSMLTYAIFGIPPQAPVTPPRTAEKVVLLPGKRNKMLPQPLQKAHEAKSVGTRPWQSDISVCPSENSFIRDKQKSTASPQPRLNKGFKLRMALRKRDEAQSGPGKFDKQPKCGTPMRSSSEMGTKKIAGSPSYTLKYPTVARVPRVPAASALLRKQYRDEGKPGLTSLSEKPEETSKLSISVWTGVSDGFQWLITPLAHVVSKKTFANKGTSTSDISQEIRTKPLETVSRGAWRPGHRTRTRQANPNPEDNGTLTVKLDPANCKTSNITRVTRDPKTKIVSVWGVDSPKVPRRSKAPTEVRRWRY